MNGYCKCGGVRFELKNAPLFVHACHCLDCKRKTGSSFSLACIVLESDIIITQGTVHKAKVSSISMEHQCSRCNAALYRTSTGFPLIAWVQTNCLEDLRCLNIGAHTWVKHKDDWLQLPDDVLQFEEGYDRKDAWPASSLVRFAESNGQIAQSSLTGQ